MIRNGTCYLNGRYLAQDDALIGATCPGIMSGYALFETMRFYRKKTVYLKEHFSRIRSSCGILKIQFLLSDAALEKAISGLVGINKLFDARVRLNVYKKESGSDILITAQKYTPYAPQKYRDGFSACIAKIKQCVNPYFSRFKTINRIAYELDYKAAKDNGFDEAIILNGLGVISEATRCNIFFVKDKQVYTPGLECGCLEGITRGVIFDLARKNKLKVYTGSFTMQDLYAADEAFFTNSLIGVAPVSSIENQIIGKKKCWPVTKLLIEKYNCLLK